MKTATLQAGGTHCETAYGVWDPNDRSWKPARTLSEARKRARAVSGGSAVSVAYAKYRGWIRP